MTITQKALFAQVRAMGLTIRKTDWSEYRITTQDGTPEQKEARAAYVDAKDNQEALDTATRMVEDSHPND